MSLTVWSGLFLIGGFQALILLFITLTHLRNKGSARTLFTIWLLILLLANLDYLVLSSGMYVWAPWLFGISNGFILLVGPLIYLYAKSLLQPNFRFGFSTIIHGLPYVLFFALNLPFLIMEPQLKIDFIQTYLSGHASLTSFLIFLFVIQLVHILTYLVFTQRIITGSAPERDRTDFKISMNARLDWIVGLRLLVFIYAFTVIALALWSFITNSFHPIANYIYTGILSLTTFYMSYRVLTHNDVVSPHFESKYGSNDLATLAPSLIERLELEMSESKVYLDPKLRLGQLAERLNTQRHHLSQIINQEYRKSFPEFVNTYRIDEFTKKVRDPANRHLSIHGLAMESGFRSKSSFNEVFKKQTGQTPSEYVKQLTTEGNGPDL